MQNNIYNIDVYPKRVLHELKYRCDRCVTDICGIHMFYTCNTPKRPHGCNTICHELPKIKPESLINSILFVTHSM